MIGAVVDEVLKEMENAKNEGMKASDDYMDTETGLLVCGKCHTKKQKKSHSWEWSVLSAVFASVRQRKWRGSVKNTGRRKNFCISGR